MRAWAVILSGLLVWTGHFFGVYIAASLFPGTVLARWLTGGLTLAALVALALLVRRKLPRPAGSEADPLAGWLASLALLGCALSGLAVVYQGLPALFD